ncbi:MAG: OB-fold protein [Mariniphaga sp.]
MKRKKIIRIGIIVAVAGIVIAGAVGLYMFNMPHRDVQKTRTDYSLASSEIVAEYLADAEAANSKYLAADGDSKVLEISGTVSKISEDFDGKKVVLLKDGSDKAGVKATFTAETSANAANLEVGQKVTLKGVIRSGAAYDQDLEMYEHVVLDKSDVVPN